MSSTSSPPLSSSSAECILPVMLDDSIRRLMKNDETLHEVEIRFKEGLSYYPYFCAVDCIATNPHLRSLRLHLSPPQLTLQQYQHQQQQQQQQQQSSHRRGGLLLPSSPSSSLASPPSSSFSSSSSFLGDDWKQKLLLRLALRMPDSPALEHLYVDAMNFLDQQFRPMYLVAFALPLCTTLTDLSLVRCGIGTSGAAALAVALPRSPSLLALNLTGNHLGCEGVRVLLESLTILSHLQELNLNDNPLEAETLDHVARALTLNTSLQVLRLNSSIPSDFRVSNSAQAVRLGTAIGSNQTLRTLASNFCDGEEPYHVAKGFAENTTLQSLSWTFSSAEELQASRILLVEAERQEVRVPRGSHGDGGSRVAMVAALSTAAATTTTTTLQRRLAWKQRILCWGITNDKMWNSHH